MILLRHHYPAKKRNTMISKINNITRGKRLLAHKMISLKLWTYCIKSTNQTQSHCSCSTQSSEQVPHLHLYLLVLEHCLTEDPSLSASRNGLRWQYWGVDSEPDSGRSKIWIKKSGEKRDDWRIAAISPFTCTATSFLKEWEESKSSWSGKFGTVPL